MSESLRNIIDKIVEIEGFLPSSLFLAKEYPNNKRYSEEYQKDCSELNSLYQKIDEIQKKITQC